METLKLERIGVVFILLCIHLVQMRTLLGVMHMQPVCQIMPFSLGISTNFYLLQIFQDSDLLSIYFQVRISGPHEYNKNCFNNDCDNVTVGPPPTMF